MAYNFNTSPYYDDYDPDDRFLRILFNPGRAVQARELTQIQSILQNQMAASGDHIWKNGSPVVGGHLNINKRQWVQLAATDSTWLNRIVFGESSLAVAEITQLHDDETQPVYYYRILSGTFQANEVLKTYDTVCEGGFDTNGNCIDNSWYDPTQIYKEGVVVGKGDALEARVLHGVYWLDAFFTPVLEQTIFLDPLSATPTCRVGFDIEEVIIQSTTDPRLLDPASGFYNQNAPGGDRFSRKLHLIKDTDSAEANKFMWLMDIEDGYITTKYESTDYSMLSNEMAQRTYDESGNYTLNPFPIEFKEGSTSEKYSIKVEPGKAYIKGFEHELLVPVTVEADRARTTHHIANDHLVPDFGPYFEVQNINDINGVFNVVNKEYVIFVTDAGHNSGNTTPNTIGVRKRITHVTQMGDIYRIYVENDIGLDAIAPALYIVAEGDMATYAKLYRPTGVTVKKGVHYPWMYNVTPITASLTLGQINFSTQKNSTATLTGAVASVPAVFNDMHWEKVLYIWDDFTQSIIPQNGTVGAGDTWTADLSGNTTALITIIDQVSGSASTNLSGHGIKIMANMYMSNANWRALSHGTSTNDYVLVDEKLTIPHATTEIISIIAPDTQEVKPMFTYTSGTTDTTFADSTLEWTHATASQPGTYSVTYKHYTFGNITTANYFAVNSFTDAGILYDDVPSYRAFTNNEIYSQADNIDFRASDNDYAVGTYLPLPDSNISASYDYYQGRKDRLTVNDDGKFQIKQGFPSDDPILPSEEENEMTLYTMMVPPYTYDHKNINVAHVKNKRFTMQDIRGIENRLEKLEYYTALNLLEKDTADMQVFDTAGLQRYKNGILVDPFVDHGIGDVVDEAYYCSIYPEAGICTVPFEMEGLDMEGGANTDIKSNRVTYTLDYNVEEAWLGQPHGSQVLNLNPFMRKSWVGFVRLIPQSDTWFEQLYLPDVIIQNENNNAVLQQVEDFGVQTRWNAWQTTWTGWRDFGARFAVGSGSETTFGGWGGAGTSVRAFQLGQRSFGGGNTAAQRTVWRNIAQLEVWQQNQQMVEEQLRTGVRSWMEINDLRTQIGDRFIDQSAIPWMRSVPVTVEVDKLRPNTVMHFEFDETNVDAYMIPDGGAMGDPVSSDEKGQIRNCVLQIPSEGPDGVRIRTGTKLLHLKDSFDNPLEMTTQAVGIFTSAGTLERRQRDILSTLSNFQVDLAVEDTQDIITDNRNVNRSRVLSNNRTSMTVIQRWQVNRGDPVAQSFYIDEEGGAFIDSIDLYFWSKDSEQQPVHMQIRTMINGYPSTTLVPLADVLIYPENITTSTDGTVSTRFQFEDPIYLMNHTEYCFVTETSSLEYNVFISELGQVDVATGEYIHEQPYLGSMFTSQNNMTWTAEQLKDVKFQINRCQFVPAGQIQLDFKEFAGIKDCVQYMPNFQPLVISGSSMDFSAIENGDTANIKGGILDNEDVVLDNVISLDGSHTIASGYTHTALSYIANFATENTNVSPVLNKERLSTVIVNNPVFDTAALVKNQMGIYQSKDVKLSHFAEDLTMWLSVQEVPNTYIKVYYDTGTVIPRYINVKAYINTITHGDYTVNDFESEYAWIYPSGTNSPENVITVQQSGIANWSGIIQDTGSSAAVSTAYVDGDDNPGNFTQAHLVDISHMKSIIRTCFISTEDLTGVGADATGQSYPFPGVTDLSLYEVDDIWFGTWDDDLDRKFYKKILLGDGTPSKVEVPVLEIDSIVSAEHPDYPIGLAVIEEDPVTWREMKDSGVTITNTAIVTNMEFIEHTFTPLKKIPNEFDHFRIKIELHTTHPCWLPAVREMRVMALT